MAISTPVNLGQDSVTTTATTTPLVVTVAAAAGSAVIVTLYCRDLFQAASGMTVADSAGNTYTLVQWNGNLSTYGRMVVFANYDLDFDLDVSDTITVTHTSTSSRRLIGAVGVTGINSVNLYRGAHGYWQSADSGYTAEETQGEELILSYVGFHDNGNVPPLFVEGDGLSPLAGERTTLEALNTSYKIVNTPTRARAYGWFTTNWENRGFYAAYNAFVLSFKQDTEPFYVTVQDGGSLAESVATLGGNRSFTVTDSGSLTEAMGGGTSTAPPDGAPFAFTATDQGSLGERISIGYGNVTHELRLGSRVPEGGVNLAWLQIPILFPHENLSIIDTASFVAENEDLVWKENVPTESGFLDSENGWLYRTIYNESLPGVSGTIGEGLANYELTRAPDVGTTPAQWHLQHFTSEIRVHHPRSGEQGIGWYPRVQDGLVIRRHILQANDTSWLSEVFTPGDELVLYYTVYEAQDLPYDSDDRTLQVTHLVTDLDGKNLQLPDGLLTEVSSIRVNDQELLSATLDASSTLPDSVVTGWDPEQGTVKLARTLDPADRVYVTYKHQAELYTFRGFYDDTDAVYRDLDLNPEPGHTYDGGSPTSELLDRPVFIYLLPTAAYRRSVKNADGSRTYETERVFYSGTRFTKSFLRWQLGSRTNEAGDV
jgi:hypothetical protein